MIRFLEEAEKIIRINSVSNTGNEEVAIYLQTLLNQEGFKTILQEVLHSLESISKRQFNIIGFLGDTLVDSTTSKGLLLNTHIDTVGPGIRAHWTETSGDPFCASIREDRIYGLGTADVKLDFLCKLKACERYRNRKLKMPIYLVGTAAEEIGMLGAKFLIKSRILNPKYCIVGEPSNLAVIHAHKAYTIYQISIGFSELEKDARGYNTRIEVHCTGKSAHSGYPHIGDNAIHKMLSVIQKIRAAHFQLKLSKVYGGDSINKVPDQAGIEFYLSSASFDDFKKFYGEHLNDEAIQVEFGGLGESGMRFMPDNVLDSIEEIKQCFDKLQNTFLSEKDESFNPSSSTINFGKIQYSLRNIDMFFDIRLLPQIAPDEFDHKLKEIVQALNARFPNLVLKVLRQRFNPALDIKQDHELVVAACESQQAIGMSSQLDKKSTSTEAAQYFGAGFPAIVFGPGQSMGNSHSPNEHNLVEHLDKAVHFYDRMIERFCI